MMAQGQMQTAWKRKKGVGAVVDYFPSTAVWKHSKEGGAFWKTVQLYVSSGSVSAYEQLDRVHVKTE